MRTKNAAILIAVVLMAGPLASNADSVTYDFSGTVIAANGVYGSAGPTVSGTFTIDFSQATPAYSSGVIGSTGSTPWQAATAGGAYFGTPTPTGTVVSSTLVSGGVSYNSATAPSDYGLSSDVSDLFGNGYGNGALPNGWAMQSAAYESNSAYIASTITLTGGTGSRVPYTSSGLPLFSNATSSFGELYDNDTSSGALGDLQYTVTSVALAAPVPLPATSWLMLSALGGFGAFARRKPRADASPIRRAHHCVLT